MITGEYRLWLSHVSPAYVRPAFPVCKRLVGGVECLTEGLSSGARESRISVHVYLRGRITASCRVGIDNLTEC